MPNDTRRVERPIVDSRMRPVIYRTPVVIFTPIKDTTGRTSGITIDLDRPGTTGLLSAFLDAHDTKAPILDLDFGRVSEKDAREEVRQLLDEVRKGTYGDPRDIRDRIAGRGDAAGLPVGVFVAAGVAMRFLQSPAGEKTRDWLAGVAGGIVAGVAVMLIGNVTGLTAWPDKAPSSPPSGGAEPPDAGVPDPPPTDGGTTDPPEDPDKTPRVDETGGRMSPATIVQVRVELKHYIPPMRDDRDDKTGGVGAPDKPIDRAYDPAINWGPDQDDEDKYRGITTRIIDNPGYVDPIPY